jgi:adrenodoxin-NADP+ reductase
MLSLLLRLRVRVARQKVRHFSSNTSHPFVSLIQTEQRSTFSTASTFIEEPLRVAIVGSGPSGFYTAKYLLSSDVPTTVDMIESLPTPYGLIRSGVAPDHQDVKSCQNDFSSVAQNDRFSFYGNVTVGKDVSVEELRKKYNAVVFCTGALSDRLLGIPGEQLNGVHSAREVVNWYNSQPDYVDYSINLSANRSGTCVIIGQGNVAVDCARILSCNPSLLKSTDIADYSMDALKKSGIKKVVVVGRRGHVQASFTMKELRELTKLEGATFVVEEEDLDASMNEATKKEIKDGRVPKRMDKLLRKSAGRKVQKDDTELKLLFLRSPVEILPSEEDPTSVGSIRVTINELKGDPGSQSARATGESEIIDCDLVLRSVGYMGVPMNGVYFDEQRKTIANCAGRIIDTNGEFVPGMFTAGWAKRGPSGIVGTNIPCARETVSSILNDFSSGMLPSDNITGSVQVLDDTTIGWQDYLKIERHEVDQGKVKGKIRDKMLCRDEMLKIAKQ